jgi:hypothetical protein
MITHFERFAIQLTKAQALGAAHPGACDADVEALLRVPAVRRQLETIDPAGIRAELKEYGAWDAGELADDEDNRLRIVWIAASNIREDIRR